MEKILLVILVLIIVYIFYDSSKEGFGRRLRTSSISVLPTPAPTTNLCSMRTTSSSCKGWGADGYCQWCSSNGCQNSDDIDTYGYKGCKG
jgi:hypothetical protein